MPLNRFSRTPGGLAVLCLPLVALVEYGGGLCPESWSPILVLTVVRLVQILALGSVIALTPGAGSLTGFSRDHLAKGLRTGAAVSILMGLGAAVLGGILALMGLNPVALVRFTIPHTDLDLVWFFVTGGLIGPVAEEMVFRGIVFPLLRPLGPLASVGINALVFALFHLQAGFLPVVPFVGGVVFATSYLWSGHIATPVMIHCLGNLALFALALV
jgi:membrane protease YdiL (CAAX protease family)